MQLSVELTVYPLQGDYKPIIRDTIERLNSYNDIRVTTFPTATILIGDYDRVMAVVKDVVAWSYNHYGRCVFLAKFLPDYVAD